MWDGIVSKSTAISHSANPDLSLFVERWWVVDFEET